MAMIHLIIQPGQHFHRRQYKSISCQESTARSFINTTEVSQAGGPSNSNNWSMSVRPGSSIVQHIITAVNIRRKSVWFPLQQAVERKQKSSAIFSALNILPMKSSGEEQILTTLQVAPPLRLACFSETKEHDNILFFFIGNSSMWTKLKNPWWFQVVSLNGPFPDVMHSFNRRLSSRFSWRHCCDGNDSGVCNEGHWFIITGRFSSCSWNHYCLKPTCQRGQTGTSQWMGPPLFTAWLLQAKGIVPSYSGSAQSPMDTVLSVSPITALSGQPQPD